MEFIVGNLQKLNKFICKNNLIDYDISYITNKINYYNYSSMLFILYIENNEVFYYSQLDISHINTKNNPVFYEKNVVYL